MAADDEIKSVRENGNAFVMWGVVILLVLHLLIFPALVNDKKAVNEIAGSEIHRLAEQRDQLNFDLKHIDSELRHLSDPQHRVKAVKEDYLTLDSDPSIKFSPDDRPRMYRVRKDLLASLQENSEKTVLLEKSKFSRELKIPGTDTAIEEAQIRLYYPTALAVWFLVLVFGFRNPLYRLVDDSDRRTLPWWCGPVPYRPGSAFWECTGRNLLWFCVVGILARLFINTSGHREFYWPEFVFGLNLTAGALAAITVVVLLIVTIVESVRCQTASGTN